jgi:3'-phosphoadenosine 5'-phosphosulfate sulfotransferase (PAPS reductase)/FAD synthetase
VNNPVSYGAGVNSTALVILLVNEGWRGDILFADTGTEHPDTYEYLAYFGVWLRERDLGITRLGAEWRRGKQKMSLIDYCEHYRVTPFPGTRWCTSAWKVEPLQRWCASNSYEFNDLLLGISAEESHRQPTRQRPLVDRGIDRNGCARIITAEGLELPRKSGCWVCPFQSAGQWRDLWEKHSELYERGERLEQLADERRVEKGKNARTTLAQHDLTLAQMAERFAAQGSMFPFADYYQPCMCRL